MSNTQQESLEAARALVAVMRQKAGADLAPDLETLEALLAAATA